MQQTSTSPSTAGDDRSTTPSTPGFTVPTFVHRLPYPLRRRLRALQRALGQRPLQKARRELRRRGVRLDDCDALEVFGGSGELATRDYAPHVRSLEIWEIDPDLEPTLRVRFPHAIVRIVDAYDEIRRTTSTFYLVGVDNPVREHGGHYEHFDLFPDILRVMKDSAVLRLLVLPYGSDELRTLWGWEFTPEHLEARARFYHTMTPEHISFHQMVAVYTSILEANGFLLDWFFVQPHTYSYHYLILKISKIIRETTPP